MRQSEAKPGDVIENEQGMRYLVLPNRRQVYVGNKSAGRISDIDTVAERSNQECKVVGYLEMTW